jgi:hypothetical protein
LRDPKSATMTFRKLLSDTTRCTMTCPQHLRPLSVGWVDACEVLHTNMYAISCCESHACDQTRLQQTPCWSNTHTQWEQCQQCTTSLQMVHNLGAKEVHSGCNNIKSANCLGPTHRACMRKACLHAQTAGGNITNRRKRCTAFISLHKSSTAP